MPSLVFRYFFVATITGQIRYLKTIYADTTLQINVCRLTTMFSPLALEDIDHKDGISNLRSLRGTIVTTMDWVLGRGMTPTFCWQKKDYQILQLPTPEQGIYVQTTEISFPSVYSFNERYAMRTCICACALKSMPLWCAWVHCYGFRL